MGGAQVHLRSKLGGLEGLRQRTTHIFDGACVMTRRNDVTERHKRLSAGKMSSHVQQAMARLNKPKKKRSPMSSKPVSLWNKSPLQRIAAWCDETCQNQTEALRDICPLSNHSCCV